MLKICLLVSGDLGHHVLLHLTNTNNIVAVFTDRNSGAIIDTCKKRNINIFIGNPRCKDIGEFVNAISCEVLLSVNYLFIINRDLIDLPSLYAINIHGSLLPKYRGRTPHVWAIINNEKRTGITAHLIDDEVDSGDIVEQMIIPINRGDTGFDLLQRFKKAYPTMIDEVLSRIQGEELVRRKQDETKATYFDKRVPIDGRIEWHWQRQRVINWVRALSYPYPGAFFYYNSKKIIVNEAICSDKGFHSNQLNGEIIEVQKGGIIVKVQNGAVVLSKLSDPNIDFRVGETLE